VAFAAGFVFARISQGARAATSNGSEPIPGVPRRYNWDDIAALAPLALLLATMVVWLVAAIFIMHVFD
jgi:hypothetical protein